MAVTRLEVRVVRITLSDTYRKVGLHDTQSLPYASRHVALSAHRRLAARSIAATLLLATIELIRLVGVAHFIERRRG